MREILIEIVKNLPAMLSAFGAIVRWGDDDDERLTALERVVADLHTKTADLQMLIEAKKHERTN